nr:asparagine synthase (glutamine-hydrolyzing) [uncultured Schaedlerella sp.]
MCGIAGFLNKTNSWEWNISKMNRRMIHRGPDAQNYWSNEEHTVVLGHVRLSIVDLSETGAQPMQSHDGRYVLVLNGEIYNHEVMRKRLLSIGKCRQFRGHSDTEILCEYIASYGFKKALQDSIGMFAVAAYDKMDKKLYLARDRMGEKPLYYGFVDGVFVFASEIGCIAEVYGNKLQMDEDALAIYFRRGYIPAPYSIYRQIRKVEAGEILELSHPFQRLDTYKYWDIMQIARDGQDNLFTGSERDAADELERLLKESIGLQMVADVPVGAFLSGGIDSTTVVSIMQSITTGKIKTFSIGFDEKDYNEASYARQTAEYLGTDHTELYVTSGEVMDVIPKMAYIYNEPFADSSQLPTYLVSRLAREKVTVSLSGDAGDELFGGYNSYYSMLRINEMMRRISYPVRKAFGDLIRLIPNDHNSRLNIVKYYLSRQHLEEVYSIWGNLSIDINFLSPEKNLPSFKYNEYPPGFLKTNVIENIMLMDMLMYLPDDILVKVDRSAMAVSLESRVPLLDKNIVEFAWTLPHNYKMGKNISKKVLRNVLYRYIPEEMMDRPKRGFAVPVMEWVRNGRLKEWAEEMLNPGRIHREAVIDEKIVAKMWNDFKKDGRGANYIWYLLMFEEWMEKCR